MIQASASLAPGAFRLDVEGHADDEATCAAVTAMQQAMILFLEQLAAMRPGQVTLTVRALEAIP